MKTIKEGKEVRDKGRQKTGRIESRSYWIPEAEYIAGIFEKMAL
jgi:hypothetical protein